MVLGRKVQGGAAGFPQPVLLQGTYVRLEPIDSNKHAALLYKHFIETPHLWDYLMDSEPSSLEEFLKAIVKKQ